MVLLNEGLLRIRDLLNTEVTKAQAGTDTTLPSQNDSGLFNAIASTKSTPTNQVSSEPATLNVTQVIGTPTANGENLSEWELRINSDAESLNRTVTAPIAKTSSTEITRIITIEITHNFQIHLLSPLFHHLL